jgi:hypothetical protein
VIGLLIPVVYLRGLLLNIWSLAVVVEDQVLMLVEEVLEDIALIILPLILFLHLKIRVVVEILKVLI